MSSAIILEAETRTVVGKGASRRLRHLALKVPAILYGGQGKPVNLSLHHHKVMHQLENEKIYSSIIQLMIDGKKEPVILKALQRHPYKPVVLHMDFQRVSAKDVLVKNIPLHFVNENIAKGVKAGGTISHTMAQVEVRCMAKDLPAFIEVDLAETDLNQVLHLSDLKLPKNVELAVDLSDGSHNHPVVSIHLPKKVVVEEGPVEEAPEVEATAQPDTAAPDETTPEQSD